MRHRQREEEEEEEEDFKLFSPPRYQSDDSMIILLLKIATFWQGAIIRCNSSSMKTRIIFETESTVEWLKPPL